MSPDLRDQFLMKILSWREPLGREECPYLFRWCLNLGVVSFRVHHFLRSDDNRALHDHPWSYVTLILNGSYEDVSEQGIVVLQRGDVAFRKASHKHTVRTSGVWTFLVTGPVVRKWGFWPKGKFRKSNKYFFIYGHHPCDQP